MSSRLFDSVGLLPPTVGVSNPVMTLRLRTFLLPLAALAVTAPAARAQYRSSPFSYNYLDINYAMTEIAETDPSVDDLTGFGGRLSFDSPEGVRVILAYTETESSTTLPGPTNKDVLRQDLEAGVGFITSPSDTSDLILDLKYLRGEWRRPVGNPAVSKNRTQNGYGIEFGTRTLMTEAIEFNISVEYRDYFTSEIGGHAGLALMFTENFGLQARYTWFDSQQILVGGLRLAI